MENIATMGLIESSKQKAKQEARSIDKIETDLFNGIPVSEDEYRKYMTQCRAEESEIPFTTEEMRQDLKEAQEQINNGECYTSEQVEKYFNALIASTPEV